MANTQAMCTSFKQDILNGLHAFGVSVVRAATTADSFLAALYFATATLNSTTTAYSATGEVSSAGYAAGGVAAGAFAAPSTSGTSAFTTPSASFSWTGVTIAAFDTCLLYNNTAAGKNAVGVFTFGSQSVTAGNFTLTMPANTAGNALIQIS